MMNITINILKWQIVTLILQGALVQGYLPPDSKLIHYLFEICQNATIVIGTLASIIGIYVLGNLYMSYKQMPKWARESFFVEDIAMKLYIVSVFVLNIVILAIAMYYKTF